MPANSTLNIISDEGKDIFARHKELTVGGVSNIDKITTIIRHSMIELMVLDQEITKLSNSILNVTSTYVCFHQNSGKDAEEIRRALLLSEDQTRALMSLERGVAIVKDGTNEPILVRMIPPDILPQVTEHEIEARLNVFLGEHATTVIPWRGESIIVYEDDSVESTNIEMNILSALCENPLSVIDELSSKLDEHKSKVNRAIKSLEQKRLVNRIKPMSFKRGGATNIFELTSRGREEVSKVGLSYTHPGRCGLKGWHYIKQLLIPYFEELGATTTVEARSGDSTTDLLVVFPDQTLAVELQLTPANALENLKRNTKAVGIDKTIFVCEAIEVAKRIEDAIVKANGGLWLCEVKLLSDFVIGHSDS